MIKRQFPLTRLRRLRRTESIRSVISETNLLISDLIWPLFVIEGKNQKQPINSMPGVERYSIDQILQKCEIASLLGISMIALFPKLEEDKKDRFGSDAYNSDNLICRCVREIKKHFPELIIICDVALDPYTDHGHDGIIENNIILNDGDIITVPKVDNTVFINGEVNLPKYISFQNGISLRKAVSQAGGFTPFSNKKESFVEYQNGNVKSTKNFLFFKFYPKVKSGSKIFIPKKPEKSKDGSLLNSIVGEILTITTSLGTLGILINSVN